MLQFLMKGILSLSKHSGRQIETGQFRGDAPGECLHSSSLPSSTNSLASNGGEKTPLGYLQRQAWLAFVRKLWISTSSEAKQFPAQLQRATKKERQDRGPSAAPPRPPRTDGRSALLNSQPAVEVIGCKNASSPPLLLLARGWALP